MIISRILLTIILGFIIFVSPMIAEDNSSSIGRKKSNGMVNVFEFKIRNIFGEELTLEKFKGKKILIVNVASYCGYTSQYKDLQILQDLHGDKVQVIAFPCNDFGFQEPNANEEIAEFCENNYGIKFPIMGKVNIKRSPVHPLYNYLSDSSLNGWNDSKPKWNFYKYLIDEEGNLLNLFSSGTSPLSPMITDAL